MPRIKINSNAYFDVVQTGIPEFGNHTIHLYLTQRNQKWRDNLVFDGYGSLPFLVHQLQNKKELMLRNSEGSDPTRLARISNAFDRAIAYCKLQHTILN